jgi:hypothetical protein
MPEGVETFEYPGPYLDQFPNQNRAMITNDFCHAVRGGAADVEKILVCVAVKTKARLDSMWDHCDREKEKMLAQLLDSLTTEEAHRFAEHILRRERMPYEERSRMKHERGEKFRDEYMQTLQPTAKQLAFLRSLGVRSHPETRLQASQMIDAALKAKKGESDGNL